MKFKVEKEEKVVKVIRFSKELNKRIEKEVKKNKITFTKFVIEACIYALDNMEDKEQ